MATLLLSAAGAVAGELLGPAGAIAGRALGAMAGSFADGLLFGKTRHIEGPRLKDLTVMASTEGAPIARLYGTARISGQVIWATRLEEEKVTETSGGKGGGPKIKTTTYRYYANFAVGLCEGPASAILRVWADGKELDTSQITMRFYPGDETQQPDSLIAAKQGPGNAPAYRGLAYVVFERLPLERFGNRIPQLSFEVMRPVDETLSAIRALNIIPGSGEFFCDPDPVTSHAGEGVTRSENVHAQSQAADWSVSMDQLAAAAPAVEAASLVVSWFATDLRCAHCAIRPGVETHAKTTTPHEWKVAGQGRDQAHEVSRHDGRPAYGGTPSDGSVIRAIRDMRARGIRPVLYPFMLMDIPATNGLPDPYGRPAQPAYPWRGRITCDPAPGQAASPDRSDAVSAQVQAFMGSAAPADFAISGDEVIYSGPDEWGYRRFILHYAHLAKIAGPVEAFLIGSELRGLTTLRDGAGDYPFVAALRQLAGEAKAILGPDVKVSYAADWSEWFGHHPADGSGDVFFHLDPLWADAAVDFIGIDNYMPLADWREGHDHADAATAPDIYDLDYLKSNIAGGEYHDWYYQDRAARDAQTRTPITDGAHGKPWVFRPKDLVSWWENRHYDRPGGVEKTTPTPWQPRSKPFWFTELGCPAVDFGANQPNVFTDPKSSESALPYCSSGRRDDAMQRQFLAAHLQYWAASGPHNPLSDVYGGPMVEPTRIFLWAWDARPWPAFPLRADVWGDAANHETGHWLNGRLGQAPLECLVRAIAGDFGFHDHDVKALGAQLTGYILDRPMSARAALQPLSEVFAFDAVQGAERMVFAPPPGRPAMELSADDLADDGQNPLYEIARAGAVELAAAMRLHYMDQGRDHQPAVARLRAAATDDGPLRDVSIACAMPQSLARARAGVMLAALRANRETLKLILPPSALGLEAGDVIRLAPQGRLWRITRLHGSLQRHTELRAHEPSVYCPQKAPARPGAAALPAVFGPPLLRILDLPLLTAESKPRQPLAAAFATPWPGAVGIMRHGASGWQPLAEAARPATMGELLDPLPPGPLWRLDRAHAIRVRLHSGLLSSITMEALLEGGNAAAIGNEQDGWEIVQFANAELLSPGVWRLSNLLRGQRGTEPEMPASHPPGSAFVLLDAALAPLPLQPADQDVEVRLKAGPASRSHSDASWAESAFTPRFISLRPLSPVHLKAARQDDGSIRFTWIRRTRTGGDPWGRTGPPLGEETESYRLWIMDGQDIRRIIETSTPQALWSTALQQEDFPSGLPVPLTVRVAQISAAFGPGPHCEEQVHV